MRYKRDTNLYKSTFVHEATHAAQNLRGLTLMAKNFENDAARMGLICEPMSGRIKIYNGYKTHLENRKMAERLGKVLYEVFVNYNTQGNIEWFKNAEKDTKITATSSWVSALEDAVRSPYTETEAYFNQYQFDPETVENVFQRDFAPLAQTGTAADQAINSFFVKTNMFDRRNNWPGRWEIKFFDGPPKDQ